MDSIFKKNTKWFSDFKFIWNYLIVFYQCYLQKSGNFVRQKWFYIFPYLFVISDII